MAEKYIIFFEDYGLWKLCEKECHKLDYKMFAFIAQNVAQYFRNKNGNTLAFRNSDDVYIACEEEVAKLKAKDSTVTVARFMEACCAEALKVGEGNRKFKWFELPKG